MLLARQFQNGTLARYPDAVEELAVFAFASSTFMLFSASLGFVPQMANVFARSHRGRSVCFRFLTIVCSLLTIPLALLSLTFVGRSTVGWVFGIEGEVLSAVVRYLRYLLPLIYIQGLRQYYMGLLIQAKRTGYVTLLNVFHLVTVVLTLMAGLSLSWPAVKTLALAQVFAGLSAAILAYAFYLRFFRLPDVPEHQNLTYFEMLAFYWPVAVTSTMFALSRPIIYSAVGRAPTGQATIASLKVSFDFAMIFHSAMNQFRHLFVTFGPAHLAGLRKLMIRVLTGLMFVMLLVVSTPVGGIVFGRLLHVEGEVLKMARDVMWVLCLIPVVVTVRNYFHGLRLIRRRTGAMAIGAICRNLSILGLAVAARSFGWLDHWTAGSILVAGFVAEAMVMLLSGPNGSSLAEIVTDRQD